MFFNFRKAHLKLDRGIANFSFLEKSRISQVSSHLVYDSSKDISGISFLRPTAL